MNELEKTAIDAIWQRKLEQDAQGLPRAERHRNLDPESADFIHALAVGIHARRILEIGGSSGLSTIALAASARKTNGLLISIEIEANRQAEAKEAINRLGLTDQVEFILGDAADVLGAYTELEFVLLDCEKEDYIRFLDMLDLAPGAMVVADNVISHNLIEYREVVRNIAGVDTLTLPIGKGLEVSHFPK